MRNILDFAEEKNRDYKYPSPPGLAPEPTRGVKINKKQRIRNARMMDEPEEVQREKEERERGVEPQALRKERRSKKQRRSFNILKHIKPLSGESMASEKNPDNPEEGFKY